MSDISAKLVYAIITHIKNEVKIRELTNTKDIGEPNSWPNVCCLYKQKCCWYNT